MGSVTQPSIEDTSASLWWPTGKRVDAVNDQACTDEDSWVAIDVLQNDRNAKGVVCVDGQFLLPGEAITLASGATVRMDEERRLIYDPNGRFEHLDAGEQTTDCFTYTAYGRTGTDRATVTVTIEGVTDEPVPNRAPVAVHDVQIVPGQLYPIPYPLPAAEIEVSGTLSGEVGIDFGDGPIVTTLAIGEEGDPDPLPDIVAVDVLANDYDPDGDSLTIATLNGQAILPGGSVALASGAKVTLVEEVSGEQYLTYEGGILEKDGSGTADAAALTLYPVPIDPPYPWPGITDSFTYSVQDDEGAASEAATVTLVLATGYFSFDYTLAGGGTIAVDVNMIA